MKENAKYGVNVTRIICYFKLHANDDMVIIINIFENIAKGHIDKLIAAYLVKDELCRL